LPEQRDQQRAHLLTQSPGSGHALQARSHPDAAFSDCATADGPATNSAAKAAATRNLPIICYASNHASNYASRLVAAD